MRNLLTLIADGEARHPYQHSEAYRFGNAKVTAAIEGLLEQIRAIERAVEVMGLDAIAFEGSDSLDAPETIVR